MRPEVTSLLIKSSIIKTDIDVFFSQLGKWQIKQGNSNISSVLP